MKLFDINASATLLFYAQGKMICQLGERDTRLMRAGDYLVAQSRVANMLLQVEMANTVIAGRVGGHAERQCYSPYGYSPIRDLAPIAQFNGEWRDAATGDYPLGQGHRLYRSSVGRFVSPDQSSPFGEGGLNAYAYCSGDPVNRIDPSGRTNFLKSFGLSPKTGLTEAMKREGLPLFLKEFIKSAHEAKNAQEFGGLGRMIGRMKGAELTEIVPIYDSRGLKRVEVNDVSPVMPSRSRFYVRGDLYIEAGNMHADFEMALKKNGFSLNSIVNVVDTSFSGSATVHEVRSNLPAIKSH